MIPERRSALLVSGSEVGEADLVGHRLECHLKRHSDSDVRFLAVHQVAQHEEAFLDFDDGDRVGGLEGRLLWSMDDLSLIHI